MEWLTLFRQTLHEMVNVESLRVWMISAGPWFYATMLAIIFCETGLIILPFLPGDSLLFALGALAALAPEVSFHWLLVGLFLAAVAGDAVNYAIGAWVGPRVFSIKRSRLFNPEHLKRASDFYQSHGPKTIVLARFLPIVRTFAPFVAGACGMDYRNFAVYNVFGAAVWVGLCSGAGFLFGNIPVVKNNFEAVVLGIIAVSALPLVVEWLWSWWSRRGMSGTHTSAEGADDQSVATPPAA